MYMKRKNIEFNQNRCNIDFYDPSETERVLCENIVYGVTSDPARPGRHAF